MAETTTRPKTLGIDLKAETDRTYGIDPNASRISRIPTGAIRPDPAQPRKSFDEKALRELADTLVSIGQIQPIVVKADPEQHDRYLIVAGERRWRASRFAKREMIDCVVCTSERTAEIQLIENIQREDLKPIEEAFAYRDYMDERDISQTALAKVVGKRPSTVSEILSLTTLPSTILEALPAHPAIPKSQLVLIAKERDAGRQMRMWEEAKSGTLTVQRGRAIAAGERRANRGTARGAGGTSGAIARSLDSGARRLARIEKLGKREAAEIQKALDGFAELLREKRGS